MTSFPFVHKMFTFAKNKKLRKMLFKRDRMCYNNQCDWQKSPHWAFFGVLAC